jgi:hypothetical protein
MQPQELTLKVALRVTALIAAVGVLGPSAYATSINYDGTWRLDGGCAADPSHNQPSFEYHWTTPIQNGAFSRTNTSQQADGTKSVDKWVATIQGSNITITVDGNDDHGHRWLRRYNGNVINGTQIRIFGDFFVPTLFGGWQKTRTCTGVFTQIAPSPSSLAATEQRMEVQRPPAAVQENAVQHQLPQQMQRVSDRVPSKALLPNTPSGARPPKESSDSVIPPSEPPQLSGQSAPMPPSQVSLPSVGGSDHDRLELDRLRSEVEQSRTGAAAAREAQEAEIARLKQEGEKQAAEQQDQLHRIALAQQQDRSVAQALNQRATARSDRIEGMLGAMILPVTERADNWISRIPAIPIQQQQFCRIIGKFDDDLEQVRLVRNDIRRNTLYRDRQADLASLLPNGTFDNWLMRVVEVTQASDGSAAILLQPPCRAMMGSDACQKDGSAIRGTIAPDTPLYRELSRLANGDFVAASGTILYAAKEERGQALPEYALYKPGEHCAGTDGTKVQDVFVTQLRYLVQLR